MWKSWSKWIKPAAKITAIGCLCAGFVLPLAAPALAASAPAPEPTPAATPAPAPVVSSPEHPLTYSSEWAELQPGEWHWYAFKYDFDDSGDSGQTPSQIRLTTEPADQATLLLLNGEQVHAWEGGAKLQGFGAATAVVDRERVKVELDTFCDANPNDPACNGSTDRSTSRCDNLHDPQSMDSTCNFTLYPSRGYATWSGEIGASGTYYILVRNNTNAGEPIRYRFQVSGDGLTMK